MEGFLAGDSGVIALYLAVVELKHDQEPVLTPLLRGHTEATVKVLHRKHELVMKTLV